MTDDAEDDVQSALDSLPTVADPGTATIESASPRWTPRDLATQMAEAAPWLPFFRDAASGYSLPQDLLLGIASRESNIRQIVGDGGRGHGIMQIDDRYFPDFVSSGDWSDARKNIVKGAMVLARAKGVIALGRGKRLHARVRGRTMEYTGVELDDDGLLRTATAAYNSGGVAYYWMSTTGDPDEGTTGLDYSADVFKRAAGFLALLGAGGGV